MIYRKPWKHNLPIARYISITFQPKQIIYALAAFAPSSLGNGCACLSARLRAFFSTTDDLISKVLLGFLRITVDFTCGRLPGEEGYRKKREHYSVTFCSIFCGREKNNVAPEKSTLKLGKKKRDSSLRFEVKCSTRIDVISNCCIYLSLSMLYQWKKNLNKCNKLRIISM
ncbi:hypothetical protein CEXT_639691 [Caerostris extrusa]|uniref:Uncharacterized protein n=1 Tax=Caerostris extrusa TaxID=172846 RepID=A0AAV4MCD6_CAEEX|nr:hypothetical protein CEXT_639691 [Caerostris extrusa]